MLQYDCKQNGATDALSDGRSTRMCEAVYASKQVLAAAVHLLVDECGAPVVFESPTFRLTYTRRSGGDAVVMRGADEREHPFPCRHVLRELRAAEALATRMRVGPTAWARGGPLAHWELKAA